MKRIKTILFPLSHSFILLIISFFILITLAYILCPVYRFEEPQPFKGSNIYNPYAEISITDWKKASLHAHTKASDGKNQLEEVQDAYRQFGYDILVITDHSKVTPANLLPDHEIPAFEHGINISMYHTVHIGVKSGSLYDYPLISSVSHRYHRLKLMNDKADIVILAHPDRTLWLEPEDMKKLTHFQFIEVPWSDSNTKQDYLDAALSAGNPVNVVSDDCHDVNKASGFARAATFINTGSVIYPDIREERSSNDFYK